MLVYCPYRLCMKNKSPEQFREEVSHLLRIKQLKGTVYPGGGVLIAGWPSFYPEGDLDRERPKRGIIKNASAKSLIRCSFALQNSSAKWGVMITLTFREQHPWARAVFRRWCEAMPWSRSSTSEWGWFREYQSRGVVHYHVILSESSLVAAFNGEPLQTAVVGRGKSRRTVIRGSHELWIVGRWLEAVGDSSAAFESFQWGGIVELLRHADSPARYLGSYASKAAQKILPRGECPGGRWWWISPCAAPKPVGEFDLWSWPLAYPSRILWDYRSLDPALPKLP